MTAIISIGVDPVLVRLGPLSVHWYGLMYVVGISAGLFVTLPYAERLGIDRETYYAIFWPVVIGCLIGGRLYYVVQSDFGWYLRHPSQILATWEGGMAFYGAVFAGVIVAMAMSRIRHVSPAKVLDVAAVFIPISQAFGRVGNLINGDIIGYPSTLAWATRYTNPDNTFVPSHRIAYQPAAAYELLFSLALFGLIWALRYRFRVPGTLFVVWLVLYSAGQFVLFFVRDNPTVFDGLKQAQVTSIVVLMIAVPAWLWWRRRAGPAYDPGGQDLRDAPSAA
ncbi:MAG TPA: prolipoprotein diacylglyceryl transferase [Chloroflexi bacterium]|jgi:phosphatidylglycerol:prolipoprotein diacylglycerol transferase|nr:prolipoprotein diacylglyceryl transferase [Chloroflexota bacterium]